MTEGKRKLKSLIYEKYDTEKECAESMGWQKQRLNKIVNGKKEPSVSEAVAFAAAIEQPVVVVINIFLSMMSPNG